MLAIADKIDAYTRGLGKAVSWLTLLMVLFMCFSVFQRYLFQSNHVWQQELILFMHSMVFLLASSYTLLEDGHVRVDVFYEKFTEKQRALVNMCGTVFLLWPVSIALIYFSYGFVLSSWEIQERSREYDGMPGIFLLKTCILLFSISLIIQGISCFLRAYRKVVRV